MITLSLELTSAMIKGNVAGRSTRNYGNCYIGIVPSYFLKYKHKVILTVKN